MTSIERIMCMGLERLLFCIQCIDPSSVVSSTIDKLYFTFLHVLYLRLGYYIWAQINT